MGNVVTIENIGTLITMVTKENNPLGIRKDIKIWIQGGRILDIVDPTTPNPPNSNVIDAQGLLVMPGFIDCHTHLVFGGYRYDEFVMRSQGMSYQEIRANGLRVGQ